LPIAPSARQGAGASLGPIFTAHLPALDTFLPRHSRRSLGHESQDPGRGGIGPLNAWN